jgi:TM2 domain-containing membrane protein YozV
MKDARRNDSLHYALALGYLERGKTRPYPLRLDGIDAALSELDAVGASSPVRPNAEGFVAALREPPELPDKSPWLAGTFSAVIPGAGSFYVGRYAEGSLALFVNAVLIYATVTSFEQDQVAAGTVFGALALAFYGGSIYAAVNGAHKFNDRAKAAYLDEQRVKFGLVVPPAGGIGAAFGTEF